MSEIAVAKGGGLAVSEVAPQSPAERAGIVVGDVVLRANGVEIGDVIDLRYETAEPEFTLTIRRDEDLLDILVERKYGEDLGLTYRLELADKIHTCNNKCVFCFIHQMPKRMRRSLYLMDDDYRLSFLHGNYVTLTNLKEGEFERIIEKGLSPMYVSVHATDPAERQRMLGKKEPQPIIPMLNELGASGIAVHAQVVLCPGFNDGPVLKQTVRELAELHPSQTGYEAGVESVAVVPVGLTWNRAHLPQITPPDQIYARAMLDQCEEWRTELQPLLGTAFVFPSDEWFFLAERAFPQREWYEDFPQFEDGIGTVRTFMDEALGISTTLQATKPVSATVLTAKIAERPLLDLAAMLNSLPGIDVNVVVVDNEVFGPLITVAGLMTGGDMLRTMTDASVHEHVFVPSICVNDAGLLLDDIPAEELSALSGKSVEIVKNTPTALATAIGVLTPVRK